MTAHDGERVIKIGTRFQGERSPVSFEKESFARTPAAAALRSGNICVVLINMIYINVSPQMRTVDVHDCEPPPGRRKASKVSPLSRSKLQECLFCRRSKSS